MQTDLPSPPPVHLSAVTRFVWADFSRTRVPLILYSVAVKLAEAWLIVPIVALGLALLLKASGHVALSNWDAYLFLMSPAGMVYLAFLGAITICLILMEQAGIMSLASLGNLSGQRTLHQLVAASFPRPLAVAQFGLILLCVIGAGFIPLALSLLLIHRMFLSQHDINYYVTEMPTDFWLAAGLGSLLLLMAAIIFVVLYVRWSLTLPIILFERQSALQAMRSSHERIRDNATRIGVTLLGWLLIVLAIGVAAEAGLGYLANGVLAQAGDQPVIPIILLLFIQTCLIATLTFLSNAGFSLITRRFYLACSPSSDEVNARVLLQPETSLISTRSGRVAGLGLCVLLAMIPASIWANLSRFGYDRSTVKVTAHRGHSRAAPENTLSAVRQAIDSGADFAEIDVLLTSDGIPVLLHDSDLKRTAGDTRRISDVTWEEARLLDVGRWFSSEFTDERIPTLEEVLQLAKGKIKLNIELKIYAPDPRLVPAVVEQITNHEFESDCIVTTFKYETLLELKRLNPRLKTGQIIAHALGDVSQLEVDALSVRANWLTDPVHRQAHRQGMEVHVWTVNDVPDMYRLIKRGVDNIITDDPDLLIRVRNQWQSLTATERLVLASRLLLGLNP